MKTLTILFESPNVFKIIENWSYKANAIRIENYELIYDIKQHGNLLYFGTHLKPGDIFQVEGFEYEEKTDYIPISRGFSYKKEGSDQIKQCDLVKDGIGYYDNGKVAILKLAKEEEQEPDIQTSDIHHTFKPHGQFKVKEEEPKEKIYTIDEVIHKLRLGLSEYGKKSGIAGYWVLEDNVYYILNKLKK